MTQNIFYNITKLLLLSRRGKKPEKLGKKRGKANELLFGVQNISPTNL